MNILVLSWRGPKHPNAGGAEISTHEHAKGWVEAGHQVTLFTSHYKNAEEFEYIDGVRIIRKGSQFFGVHLVALKWFIFNRKEQFDIVIDQFHGIPFFTPIFVRGKKLGFIHETTQEIWKLNPWKVPLNLFPSILGRLFEPFIFKLFYLKVPFMTVSNSTKRDLIKWGIPQRQVTIIYNGLNIPKTIDFPQKEKKRTLIFLGALSKDKGIENALKVFELIDREEKGKWQFWVVGKSEPEYFKKLKLQSKRLGIERKLKFWGFVSEKKKFELFSKAHIVINPSIREGWGLVVIEAASMGTPTVAFNVPGLKDSIIDNKTGIICSGNSLEELTGEILALVNNEKKYKMMSRSAILWSKKFSWEKSTRDSLALINNLVKI